MLHNMCHKVTMEKQMLTEKCTFHNKQFSAEARKVQQCKLITLCTCILIYEHLLSDINIKWNWNIKCYFRATQHLQICIDHLEQKLQ